MKGLGTGTSSWYGTPLFLFLYIFLYISHFSCIYKIFIINNVPKKKNSSLPAFLNIGFLKQINKKHVFRKEIVLTIYTFRVKPRFGFVSLRPLYRHVDKGPIIFLNTLVLKYKLS